MLVPTSQFFRWSLGVGLSAWLMSCAFGLGWVNGKPLSESGAGDWPFWRGPERTGIAAADAAPPISWSSDSNVAWRTSIPGTGHGSPIVIGDLVVIATADLEAQFQAVVGLDRATGQTLWTCRVHEGGLKQEGNAKASLASSTAACDGERIYINFLNGGAVHTSALSLTGELVWQQTITDYVVHQGYGSSPTIYENLVIVGADNKGGGAFAGLDRATGEVVWKYERVAKPNYSSPIVWNLNGRDQLILIGCDEVVALNPTDGSVMWQMEGATTECVTTPVTDGTRIFTSGGYPRNHVSAIVADGSKTVAWENDTRVYVPSMIVKDGYLYAIADAGIAYCWNAETGEECWKQRLGGTFSGSPVMAGDLLFATNEEGQTFVLQVSPEACEKLQENRLGDVTYASPAIAGDSLFLRTTEETAQGRRDFIYCIR